MLNLIVKDLLIQRKTLLIGLLYILVMVFAMGKGSLGYTASTVALVYLMMQSPCAYDDKNHADYLLNSVPLNRSTIVLAKYLSAALYLFIAVAEYSLISLIVRWTGLPFAADPIPPEGLAGLAVVTGLFAAIFYPIFFRFGYMKTRYIYLVLFAGSFAAGSAFISSMEENGALRAFVASLESRPGWMIGTAIAGGTAVLLLVSYWLSVSFYRKREF